MPTCRSAAGDSRVCGAKAIKNLGQLLTMQRRQEIDGKRVAGLHRRRRVATDDMLRAEVLHDDESGLRSAFKTRGAQIEPSRRPAARALPATSARWAMALYGLPSRTADRPGDAARSSGS